MIVVPISWEKVRSEVRDRAKASEREWNKVKFSPRKCRGVSSVRLGMWVGCPTEA